MEPASIGLRARRRLRAVAGLIAISVATTPVIATQWDLPPPKVSNLALVHGEGALVRTLASQGVASGPALTADRALLTFAAPPSPVPFQMPPSRQGQSHYSGEIALAKPIVREQRRSASGGPEVFGSVALPIGTTPYDSMWHRASVVSSRAVGGWAASFANLRDGDPERLLRSVNAWVNGRIDFVEDNIDGVPAEIWQTAADSLGSGRGDCEDYALAKLALLAALGFDRSDLYLVIARDLITRTNHAVLAVRSGERLVILDNSTDDLIEGDRANDYRPIFSYSATGRWIHGYSGAPSQPPIQIASAVTAFVAP